MLARLKADVTAIAPQIRIDRTDITIYPRSRSTAISDRVLIINEGKGQLTGLASSETDWLRISLPQINTLFLQCLSFEVLSDKVKLGDKGMIRVITNGGTALVTVTYGESVVGSAKLSIPKRSFQFQNVGRADILNFELIIQNSGHGLLTGTVTPYADWISVPSKGIFTRSIQKIPVIVKAGVASSRQLSGQIQGTIGILTNGGKDEIQVSVRTSTKGPKIRIHPNRIRLSWASHGVYDSILTITNDGAGIIRGTIPSPGKGITVIPSIFSVTKTEQITVRIDTKTLPNRGPLTIPIDLITNAGRTTISLEIIQTEVDKIARPRVSSQIRSRHKSKLTVYDDTGRAITLTTSGKSGGEGEIWWLAGDEELCAKLFHPHRVTNELKEKIRVMLQRPLAYPYRESVTWPLSILTDSSGRFLGYLMPKLDQGAWKPVHMWYDVMVSDCPKPDTLALNAALRLAKLVAAFHEIGHCIGDLRENNVLINSKGEIALIDTDSFQILDPKSRRVWYCRVGTGEYLPPELLDGSFADTEIDRQLADRFALGVLIFKFLMGGVHPYQSKGYLVANAPATTDKIRLGFFAYEEKRTGALPPDYAPPYNNIPAEIRRLFADTFISGHKRPSTRPGSAEWVDVLQKVLAPFPVRREPPVSVLYQGETYLKSRPAYLDQTGAPIIIRRRAFRLTGGAIYEIDRDQTQIFIPDNPGQFQIPDLKLKKPDINPDIFHSCVLWTSIVSEELTGQHYGFLIPQIDPERYVHWHIASDPDSRRKTWGERFSYRHRFAACRNLAATLVSMEQHQLKPVSLTERSVFVAPDGSIRLIADRREQESDLGQQELEMISNFTTLIFRMLMDGYHPFHALTDGSEKSGSLKETLTRILPYDGHPDVSPPPLAPPVSTIPFPVKRRLFHIFRSPEKSLLTISHWFRLLDDLFRILIPCKINQDHWYPVVMPTCPWCRPRGFPALFHKATISALIPESAASLTFVTKKASNQRRWSIEDTKHYLLPIMLISGPVIILPDRISSYPRLSYTKRLCLSRPRRDIVWASQFRRLPLLPDTVAKFSYQLREEKPARMLPCLPDLPLSLYDELAWTDAVDQYKGIYVPRLVKKRQVRKPFVRKTISVMLLPSDLVPEKSVVKKRMKRLKTQIRKIIRGDSDE